MNDTYRLRDFAYANHVLPERVRADAVRLLGDTLAIGAAGATAPGAGGVLATARCFGAGEDARILGGNERLPAASAAYVNGFQVHCLEWDAVHEGAVVHAVSGVVAALLAAIDRRGGCDPEAALTALAVGVDIASGLGIAADCALTFFRPATASVIGAALAVARIEGLSRAQFDDALGLAYSHCAGTMQAHSEGSIALPLQYANAARSAIHAVDLVKNGLTGPHNALEGPFGYFALFDKGDLSRYTNDLGNIWRISEVSTKPFPSGRASHAVLGTLAEVRGDEIIKLEAHVPPLIHHLVGRPWVEGMTPAYARLCLPFLVALMLTDGVIDPRRFTPTAFADPALRQLADRLTIIVDGNADPNALSPQRLVVTRADGRVEDIAIPATLGSPDAPLSEIQAKAKRDLARTLASPETDPRMFDDPLAYFTEPQ